MNPDAFIPAFPVSTGNSYSGHQDGHTTWQFPGMTLRDYFAAKAMQGFVSSYQDGDVTCPLADIAIDAYDMADAMLQARQGDAS